jgi:hypothetical protein
MKFVPLDIQTKMQCSITSFLLVEEDDENKKSNFFYCGIESDEPSQFFLKKNAMKEGGLNIILYWSKHIQNLA